MTFYRYCIIPIPGCLLGASIGYWLNGGNVAFAVLGFWCGFVTIQALAFMFSER